MNIIKLKIKNSAKQKGFALIYTMLFVILLMITVSTTWITGLADLRLSQNTQFSAEAYQLAQIGMEEGWIKYQKDSKTTITATVTFPTDACNPIDTVKYFRTWPDRNIVPTPTPTPQPLKPAPLLTDTTIGVYDYKICTIDTATTIKSIGYYKGSKITLEGTIEKDSSPDCLGWEDPVTRLICNRWDHSDDKLTITQTNS